MLKRKLCAGLNAALGLFDSPSAASAMKATDLCASRGSGHKSVQFHNQTAIYQPHPPPPTCHRAN